MKTMQSTLQIGPADWDPAQLPLEEFQARLASFWGTVPEARGIIAFGSQASHAELAYLSNFTPKLEAGIALISRSGETMLMSGGGINMLPAAKPLTWIEQLIGLRDFARTAAQWGQKLKGAGPVALVGGGAMPYHMRRELEEALGASPGLLDGDTTLRMIMRKKRAREIKIMRDTVHILETARDAMAHAAAGGRGTMQTVLAAENAAYGSGAQDVHVLFSRDNGRTWRPFDGSDWPLSAPMQAYLRVKHLGYWVEGFGRAALEPSPEQQQAREALNSLVSQIRAGSRYGDIRRAWRLLVSKDVRHPAIDDVVVSLGLFPEDHPSDDDAIEPGHVLSLRVGVSSPQAAAIVSAIVNVGEETAAMMWPAA